MLNKKVRLLARTGLPKWFGVLVLVVFGAMPGLSQTAANEPLPAAAQAAINNGINAAKESDYRTAIRHFEEARKIAPNAPTVLYDMGLAESNIPGRELRAIAWLGAYLAANPAVSNKAAVQGQIGKLKAEQQKSLLRVLKSAEVAARSLGVGVYLSSVAGAEAAAGDFASAFETARATEYAPSQSDAYGSIAVAQARAGDISGAKSTVRLIQDEQEKHLAQTEIVGLQITAGDIAGALDTWRSMANLSKLGGIESVTQSAASYIAEAQAKSGDRAGARATIAIAIKNAANITETQARDFFLSDIVAAQALCGDFADAKKTGDSIQDVSFKAGALETVAEIQAKAGEVSEALEFSRTIIETDKYGFLYRDRAISRIAVVQSRRGDTAGAKKTALSIRSESERASVMEEIAKGSEQKSDLPSVAEWMGCLEDTALRNECALKLPVFLDLPAHLKSLPADDLENLARALLDTADRMSRAQNVIYRRLDLAVGKQ